jgi:Zn-dependent oligopeptidase
MRKALLWTIRSFGVAILLGTNLLVASAQMNALPELETAAGEIETSKKAAVDEANAIVTKLVAMTDDELSFATFFAAFDDIENTVGQARARFQALENVHTDGEVRAACRTASEELKQWRTELFQNAMLYAQVKKYLESNTARVLAERNTLNKLDQRLLDRVKQEFQRNGLHLAAATRTKVNESLAELSKLMGEHKAAFDQDDWVVFTKDELSGVAADVRARFKLLDGMYHVRADGEEARAVYRESPLAATRKKAHTARMSRAFSENAERGTNIVRLRKRLAELLGYDNWAEYQTEMTMMKTPRQALKFLSDVNEGIDPLFRDDLAILNRRKAKELNDPDARVAAWDVEYFTNQELREKHEVDLAQLRAFFEYKHTMQGLLQVAEKVFGLTIKDRPLTDKWHSDVTAIDISDTISGRYLGTVFLDMFTRKGKADGFSVWSIRAARKRGMNDSQMPVVLLLADFAKPSDGSPILLDLMEVQKLFHELGHALHHILGQTRYVLFSGITVESDFEEAPAAMLEEFITDKRVLSVVAQHHVDQSKPFPMAIVDRLNSSRAFTSRVNDKRVLALAQMDLDIHTTSDVLNERFNLTLYTDRVMSDIFLPFPEATSFINTFQHVVDFGGYDGVYYKYLWASALSADLANKFREAPNGFLDATVGKSYREEVLEQGSSRDAMESVEAFLGRPFDQTAYLRQLGVSNPD